MTQDHKLMPREIWIIGDYHDSSYKHFIGLSTAQTESTVYILRSEYDKLQAENERLREALRFYDAASHIDLARDCFLIETEIGSVIKGGKKAREALEGK